MKGFQHLMEINLETSATSMMLLMGSKILISKKTEGEIINLGSGKPVKIKRMVELIVKIIGKGIPVFGAVRYRKERICF